MPDEHEAIDHFFNTNDFLMKLVLHLPTSSLWAMRMVNKQCSAAFSDNRIWRERYEAKIGRSLEPAELKTYICPKYEALLVKHAITDTDITSQRLAELIYHDDIEPLYAFIKKNQIDIQTFELHQEGLFEMSDDNSDDTISILSPFIYAAKVNSINTLRYIFNLCITPEEKKSLLYKKSDADSIYGIYPPDAKSVDFRDCAIVSSLDFALEHGHIRIIEELFKMIPATGITEKEFLKKKWIVPETLRDYLYNAIEKQNHCLVSFIFQKHIEHGLGLSKLLEMDENAEYDDNQYGLFIHAVAKGDIKILKLIWGAATHTGIDKKEMLYETLSDSIFRDYTREYPYLKLLSLGDSALPAVNWLKQKAEEENVSMKKVLEKLLFDSSESEDDPEYKIYNEEEDRIGDAFKRMLKFTIINNENEEDAIKLLEATWQEAMSYDLPCHQLLKTANSWVFRHTINKKKYDVLNWLTNKALEAGAKMGSQSMDIDDELMPNSAQTSSFYIGIVIDLELAVINKYNTTDEDFTIDNVLQENWPLEDGIEAILNCTKLEYPEIEIYDLVNEVYSKYGTDGIRDVFKAICEHVIKLDQANHVAQSNSNNNLGFFNADTMEQPLIPTIENMSDSDSDVEEPSAKRQRH